MTDKGLPVIGQLGFKPAGPIVRAQDLARWSDALHLLDRAREQADRILEDAEEEAVRIRQAAEQRGFSEGEEKMLAQLERNGRLIQATIAQLSRALPDLVTGCVEKIVGEMAPEALTHAVVRKAIDQLHSRGRLTLQVAPNQQESVQQFIREYAAAVGSDPALFSVRPNPELGPGDLLVETAVGLLDATLETQIDKLRQVLSRQAVLGRETERTHAA